MQSSLCIIPPNPNPITQWKPIKTLPIPSSKTHSHTQLLNLNQQKPEDKPATLPVAVRTRSGGLSRYVWDNKQQQLRLMDVDKRKAELRDLFRVCGSGVRDFLLPREISDNYLGYVKWKFVHRVFSSALQVLATQAMFRAIGIGYSRSLPSAAALNWVLKDGLGRLSRCIYTASLASAFDTNLKRVRFSTSVMFSLSIGVELLTPAFPHYFLLLATVANIAKQISLACYLATGTAVHRSFAIADNLGEVSAKGQIQTVCFDNFGLMLAAALNIAVRNNSRMQAALPFIVYPIFSALDLIGIYQGLKHVHLQTLTKDRLEIIINSWVKLGQVPSPAEVSEEEGIGLMQNKGRVVWPIRIGYVNPNCRIPRLSMLTMRSLKDEDFYFIILEMAYSSLARNRQQGIVLCMREAAGTTDLTMGLLQACYFREAIFSNRSKLDTILEAYDSADLYAKDWFELIEESKRYAQHNFVLLNNQMVESGWACKNILLSTQEQVRYSFVDD